MRDLRFWRWRQAEDDDIDREFAVHLDLATEERSDAGLTAGEARLAARRQFGNVSLTKEELKRLQSGARLEWVLGLVYSDFLYGLRLLRRAPGFTVVAVLILALPIAASTIVFGLLDTVLLQSRPGRIDALVSVFSRDLRQPESYRDLSYPLYVDLRDRSGAFDSLLAHTVALVGVREGNATRRVFAEIVSANYFSTLGLPLAAGRPFSLAEERPGSNEPVAIASYQIWRNRGFDASFIGSQVEVNGTRLTIVGVAPKGLRTTTLVAPDWWFPLGSYDRLINEWFRQGPKGLGDRANHALFVAGALKPGLSRTAAEQALQALSRNLDREYPDTDHDRAFALTDVPRLNLRSQPQNEQRVTYVAGLLLMMAALVLGIACLNLANLMLARGAARRKEIGIRRALGGGRGRIVGQLLVEGLSLSTIGAVVGVMLAWWGEIALTRWLNGVAAVIATGGVDLTLAPSLRMVVVAVTLAVFNTVCFALGPAWRLTRAPLTSDLSNAPSVVVRRFGSGRVLVGLQLAISTALLAVAGLFVRGAMAAATASPGFALDRQLVFSIDPSFSTYDESRTRELYRQMLQRVEALPGVEHASLASKVAFGEFVEGALVGTPDRKNPDVAAGFTIVTSEYFDTLRLPLLRGRAFSLEENTRSGVMAPAVISQPLARRLFLDGDPLGRPVTLRQGSLRTAGRGNAETEQTLIVVGVVPGTMQDIVEFDPQAQVYVPYGARFRAAMTLHVGIVPGVDETRMLSTVQRELRRLDDQLPILTARTMTAQRDASIPRWAVRAAAMTFGLFGMVALAIAVIGVYGLAAYEVTRRTRELGIRMALGATTGDIKRLVLKHGLGAAAFGLSLGLLLAAGIGRLVRSILYGVSPMDPAALVTAVLVLTAATVVACYVPARRAARVAVLQALRTD